MKKSLTRHAKKQISKIHSLSRRYNASGKPHTKALIKLVEKHAGEINKLYKDEKEHFSVEVGDLLILCHELLLEKNEDADDIMELCYDRYKKKLTGLIKTKRGRRY